MSSLVQVIEPEGILDGTKTVDFRNRVNQLLDSGTQVILIDFKNVTFMDSSGLGSLVSVLKMVSAAEAKLFLCSINEQIKMLFELTSMDRYFAIYANRDDFEKQFEAQITN
jgi:anti-anti-sigma factor